jgi:N utilization substance protein B
MGRRSKARECAFQMLYQWEVGRGPFEDVVESFWRLRRATPDGREMAERLARGAHARAAELDAEIAGSATHWRIDRIATVERSILRLGAYELRHEATPPSVVIDEAIELAKRFGEAESPGFVNGVLDGILKAQATAAPEKGKA